MSIYPHAVHKGSRGSAMGLQPCRLSSARVGIRMRLGVAHSLAPDELARDLQVRVRRVGALGRLQPDGLAGSGR